MLARMLILRLYQAVYVAIEGCLFQCTCNCFLKIPCLDYNKYFDDLTDTIFENHHVSIENWILCLYFMGLDIYSKQISKEPDLDKDTIFCMCSLLQEEIAKKNDTPLLEAEIELDEVYIIAGHEGNQIK
jgi:hypothetical protein